ncbi:MAG: glycosyltransferase [Acidobacteria bacterium]|nr:glycosyltransferase [Acidobacteriota bacterium]
MKVGAGLANSRDYPRVSVVIPVYNGSATIGGTIECLLKQTLAPREIIVVDDGSTDDTVEVLQRFGDRLNIMRQPNGGPSSARNRGLREATGEFVALTDSDCLPEPKWLSSLIESFDSPRVAGVGGTIKGVDENLISVYVDAIQLLDPGRDAQGEVQYLVTANACFRRDAVIAAGLFDERFRKPGAEDTELGRRLHDLGYQLKAAPTAVVLHHHKQTLKIFLKTICNYGEGAYLLGTIRPEYKWKGDIRKGLIASVLGAHLLRGKSRKPGTKPGWSKYVAFSALDYLMSIAFSWGYLRGQRKARKSCPARRVGIINGR